MATTHAQQTRGPGSEAPAHRPARQPAPVASSAADGARLTVQRSLGNDYLQRTADCGSGGGSGGDSTRESGGGGCSGGCGGCALSRLVQTKLRVSAAGDAYEKEADRVADRVVGMSAQAGTGDPARSAPRIDVQRLPADPAGPGGGPVDLALPSGGGRPLSEATRSFMEPRFHRDFGDVRVHSGPDADGLAQRIRARAFTHQQHVYLRAGESEHDHRLMAHELTHVIQQSGGSAWSAGSA
ncbi:MAG TPA: DUF4157 domain-containing protein, partial [Rugosimonospora sp.]